jgi:molybdopterin-biosynthesis enzyme MoeA-like protein
MNPSATPTFGLIIVAERGLALSWVRYVGDDRPQITAALKDAFANGQVVFSCGGIGATPDDHTRQCAAAALGVELVLHEEAKQLIQERMQDVAREQGVPYDPERPDNQHRLNMGVFPHGAHVIPNPYNKIPGFSCTGPTGGVVHFVPGFPVMAWPMVAWVLDTQYAEHFRAVGQVERSVIVKEAMESTLTPLMEQIEAAYLGIKVFSLPSVDHPEHGRHIELGVKGDDPACETAYQALHAALQQMRCQLGPELVRC